MKSFLHFAASLFIASFFVGASLHAQAPAAPRLVAIFIENRAGPDLADKTAAFEDLLSARITTAGFSIVARDTATTALGTATPGGTPTPADQLLNNQTSALRLAQSLNADYVLVATLVSYGSDVRAFSGYGVNTLNRIYTLRATYRLCDAAHGGSLIGDTVAATDTIPQTANASENNPDELNKLIDQAASSLADSFLQNAKSVPTEVAKDKMVNFSVICTMADLNGLALTVPDLRLTDDNRVVDTNQKLKVEPLDVTVELDGVAIGSAPGAFQVYPGLHKIRLTREGFKDWEGTINVYNQQIFKVALQMTDSGYARWKDMSAFIWKLTKDQKLTDAAVRVTDSTIQNNNKLTDAEVRTTDSTIQNNNKLTDAEIAKERILAPGELEVLKGQAQMLQQSGFKVDYKVDTKDNIKIQNSFY